MISVEEHVLPERMNAHFYRLFLDACAGGSEHPAYLRSHGLRINEKIFGITAFQILTHQNDSKRLPTHTLFAAKHPTDVDGVNDQEVSAHKVRVQKLARMFRKEAKYRRVSPHGF